MDVLINPSESTPEISFEPTKGILSFKGVCAPHDTHIYFDQVEQVLQKKSTSLPPVREMFFEIDYFNTTSIKRILHLLVQQKNNANTSLLQKVTWVHQTHDVDLLEEGKLLQELSGLPFSFVAK